MNRLATVLQVAVDDSMLAAVETMAVAEDNDRIDVGGMADDDHKMEQGSLAVGDPVDNVIEMEVVAVVMCLPSEVVVYRMLSEMAAELGTGRVEDTAHAAGAMNVGSLLDAASDNTEDDADMDMEDGWEAEYALDLVAPSLDDLGTADMVLLCRNADEVIEHSLWRS